MTSFETSQGFVNIEKYRLNVTARLDTANREHMKDLVEKTVKVWLYVAKNIEAGTHVLSLNTTPEDMIKPNHFAPIAEPRVTVWGDLPGGSGFTVHSHSHPQDALDVYVARLEALAGFAAPQEPPKPQMPLSTQGVLASDAPSTPPDAKLAQPTDPSPNVDGVTKVSGKKTAATLPNGSLFELPIYQVKLQSKNDVRYYEVFTKYGSKLGDWPELTIYSDNEIAKTNGVLDFLGKFDLTPGKDKMGEWVLRGVVKDKGDKKNLYAVSIREAA